MKIEGLPPYFPAPPRYRVQVFDLPVVRDNGEHLWGRLHHSNLWGFEVPAVELLVTSNTAVELRPIKKVGEKILRAVGGRDDVENLVGLQQMGPSLYREVLTAVAYLAGDKWETER